jgi:nucleotide-binding universal stress UspA family protein
MLAAFQSILVALDGGQGGLDAAALGAELAGPESALALAHVLTGATRARPGDEVRQEAVEVMRPHRSDPAGPDPPLLTTRGGSVVAGLRELVDAHGGELVVVGVHHHRHLNLARHDHTRDALRRLPCAVAVAPRHYARRPPAGIAAVGVGYVDDRGGRVVLDTARGVAWQLGAEVHATTIVASSNWPDADSGAGWRALSAARRMAQIPGVHGTASEGDPYHALLALSREVDLLVVGTHHHSALRRLLPGDVAEGLSHAAGCPLLVVPH